MSSEDLNYIFYTVKLLELGCPDKSQIIYESIEKQKTQNLCIIELNVKCIISFNIVKCI